MLKYCKDLIYYTWTCIFLNLYDLVHCSCTNIFLPLGADPTITGRIPLYRLENPPDFINPCLDCKRVFNVSNGCSITSTDVPANPPAYF